MSLQHQSNRLYDVVVIGGGPAGAAAATLLQRLGHRCLVLEGSMFPRYHIGESLIPQTFGVLDRLGLLPGLRASHFPEKHSVRFVSSSGRDSEPFYFSERIDGERARTWQIERSEFDSMLLDNARAAGVEVRMGTRIQRVLFQNGRAVGTRAKGPNGETYEVGARVIIDASGRATLIGSQLNLRGPVPGLDKSSCWAYYRGGWRGDGTDAGETTVFMLPQRGWSWYIPLPDNVISIGIVASPEHLFAESKNPEQVFLRVINDQEALLERLSRATRVSQVRAVRRLAYRNSQTVGDGWVMVGDAAAFLDPIYSSGVFLALASAEMAAGSVHAALQADDTSAERLGTFTDSLTQGIEVIQRLIFAFYDPRFSFGEFARRFPEQRSALIDCLIGDVLRHDMTGFLDALAQMTSPPIEN